MWAGFALILLVIALPYPVSTIMPLPLAVAVALAMALLGMTFSRSSAPVRIPLLLAVVVVPALWGISAIMESILGLDSFGGAFLYFLLFPMSVALGMLIVGRGLHEQFLAMFRVTTYILALISIVERGFGRSIFGYFDFAQDDVLRSTAGQFHPIVLGVLLVCGMATCVQIEGTVRRALALVFLLAGIAVTDSLGPLVFGLVIGLAVIFPQLLRISRWTTVVVLVATAIMVVLSSTVWSTEIVGTTVDQYSDGYRSALYAMLPDLLSRAPLGYGPSGLPAGAWLIYSEYLGVRDVSMTVDAEPVLLASEWGFIGVISFASVAWLGGRSIYRGYSTAGLTLLALTFNGLTVALHAWLNLALLWGILIGIAAWGVHTNRRSGHSDFSADLNRLDRRGAVGPRPAVALRSSLTNRDSERM